MTAVVAIGYTAKSQMFNAQVAHAEVAEKENPIIEEKSEEVEASDKEV